MDFGCCECCIGRWWYPYQKHRVRWLRMWTASQKFCLSASECRVYQRGEQPIPSAVSKTKHPALSAHTSLPLHYSPFLYLSRPHLFICPAGFTTKTLSPSFKWSSNPTCFVLLIFPLPEGGVLSEKLKWGKDEGKEILGLEKKGDVEWDSVWIWEKAKSQSRATLHLRNYRYPKFTCFKTARNW